MSSRGGTQAIGQRVQIGLRYTGRIVTIEIDEPPCGPTTTATSY